MPGVRYSAAVGIDSERTGTQRLHVVAEVRDESAATPEYRDLVREIVSACTQARGHRPARVLLVRAGTIPKTSSGKIQRSRLAQMIQADELRAALVARVMEIGAHLPVYGAAATREGITLVARRVEALGFDSLWVSDHVVIPWEIRSRYPYNATGDFPLSPATDFLEPLTALTLAAAVTARVRLGTSVLVLPHRHPVLTAKMLATLDHLAPGRVILGAGVGWMREEIELFGVPYGRRGAWTDEAIAVMRACWRDDRVSHRGEFFSFENLGCRPRPASGTIPIWIGGHTDRALKRVATLGDGWHAAFPTPAALGEGIARLRAACQSDRPRPGRAHDQRAARPLRQAPRRRPAGRAARAERSRRRPRDPRVADARRRRDDGHLRALRHRGPRAPLAVRRVGYSLAPDFAQSSRNFLRPMSVSGCFISCCSTLNGIVHTWAPALAASTTCSGLRMDAASTCVLKP